MMTDLEFYVGERMIARGSWAYVPHDGMRLRLELPDGALVCQVKSAEGVGIHKVRSRAEVVPVLVSRGVRVQVEPIASIPDDPSGLL